ERARQHLDRVADLGRLETPDLDGWPRRHTQARPANRSVSGVVIPSSRVSRRMNDSFDQNSFQPSSPRTMKPLSGAIWVTCFRIARHFRSRGSPAMSIQVVIDASGTSIFAANASNSAFCSSVASSGGSKKDG